MSNIKGDTMKNLATQEVEKWIREEMETYKKLLEI